MFKNVTPLAFIYLLFAVAGFIFPWYYNLQAIQESGGTFSFSEFASSTWTSAMAKSLSVDFLIGSSATTTFIIAEGLRLKMRYWWVFIPLTFLVAFAFACPLFLFFRELELRKAR